MKDPKELTVKVTEGEARIIGERRHFRAHWKGRLLLPVICCVVTIAIAFAIPDDAANWFKALVFIPFFITLFVLYWCLVKPVEKAGKDFARRVKSG